MISDDLIPALSFQDTPTTLHSLAHELHKKQIVSFWVFSVALVGQVNLIVDQLLCLELELLVLVDEETVDALAGGCNSGSHFVLLSGHSEVATDQLGVDPEALIKHVNHALAAFLPLDHNALRLLEIDVYRLLTGVTSRDQNLALLRILGECAEGQWRGLGERHARLLVQREVGVVVVIALF